MTPTPSRPWYREPWPWLLMSGPATVVLAGIATTVLAVTSFDGLVADDYYKQGLAINRTIARDQEARSLGVDAAVQFNPDRTRVRVVLHSGVQPAAVRLALIHPTRPDADQALVMQARGDGTFEGSIRPPHAKTIQLRLQDAEGKWRLEGAWKTQHDGAWLAP